MNLDQIKKDVDLREYAADHYSVRVGQSGKASCPLHPPDKNASFSIFKGNDGTWRWKCHHEGIGGSIVDLKARLERLAEKEAISLLLSEFDPTRPKAVAPRPPQAPFSSTPAPATPKQALEIAREHVYVDAAGSPVFKKIKYNPNPLKISWAFLHHDGNGWQSGKGGRELIPYHLDKFKNQTRCIICEGEKDADTINGLGLDLFATSAPTGCSSWPESITPCFAQFKEVIFLYDVGTDEHVLKHAAKLKAAYPKLAIRIAKVPGTEPNFDITDYLADMPAKADAIQDILDKARTFSVPAIANSSLAGLSDDPVSFLKTGSELQELNIEIEYDVAELLPSQAVTVFYGRGGIGKTWITLQLAQAVSQGREFFGRQTKKRPVVYIDFENPLPVLVERVRALDIRDVLFWHQGFDPVPPKLDGPGSEIYKRLPVGSLIIIDTLRAAHNGDENASDIMGPVMGGMKALRDAGHTVFLIHHSPRANDKASKGSTAITDLADHVLALYRVRQDTREQVDDDHDPAPDALFRFGTGDKTRFKPAQIFIQRSRAGGFSLADDPDEERLSAIAGFIKQAPAPVTQSAIAEWSKDELEISKKGKIVALLLRGEGCRWKSQKVGVKRVYVSL